MPSLLEFSIRVSRAVALARRLFRLSDINFILLATAGGLALGLGFMHVHLRCAAIEVAEDSSLHGGRIPVRDTLLELYGEERAIACWKRWSR